MTKRANATCWPSASLKIEAELAVIAQGRVVDGDPAEVEKCGGAPRYLTYPKPLPISGEDCKRYEVAAAK